MANKELRERAIALRKEQKSYSEIKSLLGISKGTLSGWLKDYPLTRERINELRGNSEKRIERYRETMRKKRDARIAGVVEEQRKVLFPLSRRDLLVAGYVLYWGEGLKAGKAEVGLANTDPAVIRLFIEWLEKGFAVLKQDMSVKIHFYSDMNIEQETAYWAKVTGIPRSNFRKPYIKESTRSAITYKGMHGHGTCNVSVGGARLQERVIGSIKLLQERFGLGA